MQKLHTQEVNVLTYHFGVQKTIGISYYKAIFMENHILRHCVVLSTIIHFNNTFSIVSQVIQTKIICKGYATQNYEYQFKIDKNIGI